MIGMTSYDQYTDKNTDTVIYAFNKIIRLLLECNPNTCELLGLNEEHYLYLSPIGRELLANRRVFLSRRAIQSFGSRTRWRGTGWLRRNGKDTSTIP